MAITDWADVLRNSPIFPYKVEEHNNWKNNRPVGSFKELTYLTLHHDGSPVGPSPGDVQWLITEYNAGRPSAQIIIGYDGTWHFCGSGIAYHAGNTDGVVTNFNSVGTETDQTTGETPSPRIVDSFQRGYAAIFKHEKWPATRFKMHKMIARPIGRKPDFDFGTKGSSYDPQVWAMEWSQNVAIIQNLMVNGDLPQTKDWDEMATKEEIRQLVDECINAAAPMIARTVWSQIIKEYTPPGNPDGTPAWGVLFDAAQPRNEIYDRIWSQIIKEGDNLPVWALLVRAVNGGPAVGEAPKA